MLEKLAMTGFAGGGSDNGFLKGFWRFLKTKREFRFSAFSYHKNGFTLAEVLITLGIIGIVVAMTLPALIADHREKQTVNQVLAFYSKLSQATKYIIHEEGEPSVWFYDNPKLLGVQLNNAKILPSKYKKYMKVLTDCGKTSSSCIAPEYKTFYNDATFNFVGHGGRYNFVLQDGSSVSFHVPPSFPKNPYNKNKKKFATIYYDTNGVKPPNQFGYDMFQFDLTDDGIYAYSGQEFINELDNGYNNSYWIITHKNLDYQRCTDEIKQGAIGCKKKKK